MASTKIQYTIPKNLAAIVLDDMGLKDRVLGGWQQNPDNSNLIDFTIKNPDSDDSAIRQKVLDLALTHDTKTPREVTVSKKNQDGNYEVCAQLRVQFDELTNQKQYEAINFGPEGKQTKYEVDPDDLVFTSELSNAYMRPEDIRSANMKFLNTLNDRDEDNNLVISRPGIERMLNERMPQNEEFKDKAFELIYEFESTPEKDRDSNWYQNIASLAETAYEAIKENNQTLEP
jgi:hypothetical protein